MIVRIYNPSFIDSVLKQYPEAFPYTELPDPAIAYYLMSEAGLFPCVKLGDVMECHAAIDMDKRGQRAVEAAREMFRWVFENTDCVAVTSRATDLQARIFCRLTGLKPFDDYYRLERWAVL